MSIFVEYSMLLPFLKLICDLESKHKMATEDSTEEWLDAACLSQIKGLPDYGFRLNFDHEFKEKCTPFMMPRLHQIPGFLSMSFRLVIRADKNS